MNAFTRQYGVGPTGPAEAMWLSFRSHLEVTGPHTMGTEFTHKVLTKSLCV